MSKSIQREIGQLIIAGFRGNAISKDSNIVKYINKYNIAGVILYDEDLEIGGTGSRNITSPNQLKKLSKDLQNVSKKTLFISVDQEGGEVHRLKSDYGFLGTPSWKKIGSLNNELMTREFSENISSELFNAGINLNFAPVLDLDHGNGTVISDSKRSFTNDSEILIKHAKIFIESHKSKGIITSGKHFPGIGTGKTDTHEDFTDLTNSWSVKDLQPFNKLIKSNDLDMIMISHAFNKRLDPLFPASLSRKVIQEMLRDDLGFNGIVICDDPRMREISNLYSLKDTFKLMINAGIDLFCLGNNLIYDEDYIPKSISVISDLVNNGEINIKKIHQSIERINTLKKIYNLDV
jgi:beta-N-acetylhexosaminidase